MAGDQARQLGQALLNSELYNGLAAKDAENHAIRMAQIRAGSPAVDSDKVDELEAEVKRLRSSLENSRIVAQQAQVKANGFQAAITEKDALILEWMHSNEAFKRLARQYGKKLGVTDEQRQNDFDNQVLDVAEEDPKFQKTELAQTKKKNAGTSASR